MAFTQILKQDLEQGKFQKLSEIKVQETLIWSYWHFNDKVMDIKAH